MSKSAKKKEKTRGKQDPLVNRTGSGAHTPKPFKKPKHKNKQEEVE